jgi:hypothetical protein
MFWRKKEVEKKVEETVGETEAQKRKRRSSPKDASDRMAGIPWQYMKDKHGLTGEQLADLRQATWDGVVGGKPVTVVRIFDPAAATKQGVNVEDYHNLDNHPELILYEGYYYTSRGQSPDIHIEKKNEWVRG